MATITSAQSGNWSATSTWVGGVVPTSVDTAVAATGHVVTIDIDPTVVKVTQAGTGRFELGNGRTLNAIVEANAGTFSSGGTVKITATSGATINGNIIGVSTTTASIAAIVMGAAGPLTINGNITGSLGDSSLNICAMVYSNVPCTITVNGSVTGGPRNKQGINLDTSATGSSLTVNFPNGNAIVGGVSGYSENGVNILAASCTLTVIGNIAGQSTPALLVSGASITVNVTGNVTAATTIGCHLSTSNANCTITGNVSGGSGQNTNGLYNNGGTSVITITGNVTAGSGNAAHGVYVLGTSATVSVTGNITAGAGASSHGLYASGASSTVNVVGTVTGVSTVSHGIRSDATANGVILTGSLVDSLQGSVALFVRVFRLTATNNGTTTYTNTVGYPNGTPVTRISPNLITGMPVGGNVRSGTVYGFNNELTGTLAVPPAASVASGVPVDNTVGTAALSPSDLAAMIGAQVAAAVSSPPVV